MNPNKQNHLEYPFGKPLVCLSAIMAVLAIVFTVGILQEPHLLLVYITFASLLTVAMFALKFYVYFMRETEQLEKPLENRLLEGRLGARKRRVRWSVVILLCLALLSFFLPVVLIEVTGPFIAFTAISGFVVAVSVPEVILYLYAQHFSKKR